MIVPPPWCLMMGITCCMATSGPTTSKSKMCWKMSGSVLSTGASYPWPAQLTSASILPKCASVRLTIPLISSGFVMSAGTATESLSFLESCSSFFFERATSASFAPFSDRSFAVAYPIPDEAPVTITTLFLISIKSRFSVAVLHSNIESPLSNIPSDFQ